MSASVQKVFAEDCANIEYLLENCTLVLRPENRFFVGVQLKESIANMPFHRVNPYGNLLSEHGLAAGESVLAYTGTYDFGHTTTEWKSVITLGIAGLRKRIAEYEKRHENDPQKREFCRRVGAVYEAALRFMCRCAEFARQNGKTEMADSLIRLTEQAPATLYEAMQTSLVYYTLQQYFDGTPLRTMGRLDSLFYPYFKKEDPETASKLTEDYLWALNGIRATANLPFALGGTDEAGNSLVNELSYLILDTYRRTAPPYVKLHLLCSENMPDDLIRMALTAVREGSNSIVFLSDKRVIESLVKLGEEYPDAVDYHVVGCYECGGNGELTCSCNARVNIPKAIEYALSGGRDVLSGMQIGLARSSEPQTFEEFSAEFTRQLQHLCRCAMKATDLWEEHAWELHASPFLSASYTSALEKGGDLYGENTAKYNNSSVNALGLATAADSLYAIKKLVFEEKRFTPDAFAGILFSDWKDQEALRLYCRNRLPKYGTANAETDALARMITAVLADTISGQPNRKGGQYRLGLFSIDWRWDFGKMTAASADGRKAGEPLSQNTGASFGGDKEGTTAHLLSAASLDTSRTPNGAIVDADLHRSAVQGENGLNALMASLKTYFALGGFAVHYNVLDTAVLQDARKHPERYPNLQVRLCGWNVLFSSLSDREKDEFILRSMHQQAGA